MPHPITGKQINPRITGLDGNKVRERVFELGISFNEIATRMGLSAGYHNLYINLLPDQGYRVPNIVMLLHILDLNIEDIAI